MRMLKTSIYSLMLLMSLCVLPQVALAVCVSKIPATFSVAMTVPGSRVNGTWYHTSANPTTSHYTIINCSPIDEYVKTKQSEYDFAGSNIDITTTHTNGSTVYYKIVGTSSAFVNTHGYASFHVSSTYNNTEFTNRTETFPTNLSLTGSKIKFQSFPTSYLPDQSATKSAQIGNARFYFTGTPAEAVNVTFNIGKLFLTVHRPSDNKTVSGEAFYTMSLNITPAANATCSINPIPTVTLPQITTLNMNTQGSEPVGQANFSVITTCSNLASTQLYYTMSDNGDLANNTNVLTNTTPETDNVGVKIYDASNDTAIVYGDEYVLGTLAATSPATLTKNFYAKYYKKDNLTTNAGAVTASAIILVSYK